MGFHPLNLIFRFLLELAALAGIAYGAWQRTEGWIGVLLAIGLPLLAAAVWGTFAVPGDKSRSGQARVAVTGVVRLALELAVFGVGAAGFYLGGARSVGLAFAALVTIHYLISYDRVAWLLEQKAGSKPAD